MAAFNSHDAIRITMLAIASQLLSGALGGDRTATAQEALNSPPAAAGSNGSNQSDLRARQAGESSGNGARDAASDKRYHDSVGSYLPLNVLWRIQTGGGDRTITTSSAELKYYPLDGAIFYIAKKEHPAVGTVPLYLLYNGYDHMVSLDPHEGEAQGYHVERVPDSVAARTPRWCGRRSCSARI